MRKLKVRYLQFGGVALIKEYYKLGLVLPLLFAIVRATIYRKPYKSIYGIVRKRVDCMLHDKFFSSLVESKKRYEEKKLEHSLCKKVWFCWLQGLEHAPEIVKACYVSQKRYLQDREIVVITGDNYRDYVDLPCCIEEKWRRGIIPDANFSDCIRLELLIKYGGTWIDASVLCTGRDFPKEFLNSKLFMYRYTDEKFEAFNGISNWFITSETNSVPLMIVRDLIYEYWERYDCVLEYYMFHVFFSMVAQEMPEIVEEMPKGLSVYAIELDKKMSDDFNRNIFWKIASLSCFHKLNCRVNETALVNENSFYYKILDAFCENDKSGFCEKKKK